MPDWDDISREENTHGRMVDCAFYVSGWIIGCQLQICFSAVVHRLPISLDPDVLIMITNYTDNDDDDDDDDDDRSTEQADTINTETRTT